MEYVEEKTNVYIKVNDNNEVIDIASQDFITDVSDYILIDSGYGDRYRHAQSQYLEKELLLGNVYRYIYNETTKQIEEKDQV